MTTGNDARLGSIGAMVLVAGLGLLAGCRFPTTVYGRLALAAGEQGDVRLSRVELHDSAAWDSASLYEVTPDSGGTFYRAAFEFPAVEPGPYYLLAWQDRDGDGKVGDGDLVGVRGDSGQPGRPGKPVIVYQNWTVDVGSVAMRTYEVVEVNTTGRRSLAGDTTTFTYSFNHDVFLTSLAVTFPGQQVLPDPNAPGAKSADSTYVSAAWSAGGQMPGGMHQLEFRGVFRDSTFAIRAAVLVE